MRHAGLLVNMNGSKTVALTGAGGFLGRELISGLGRTYPDWHLIAISNAEENLNTAFSEDNYTQVGRNYIFENYTLLSNVDILIHAAFPRSNDSSTIASGLHYCDKLFELSSRLNIKTMINVSSQSVYDQNRTEPAIESSPLCLQSEYAVGKYATELLADAHRKDMTTIHVRLASLIGPGFEQRVLNKFIEMVSHKTKIEIHEHGRRFNYLDVRDAAIALIKVCEKNEFDSSGIFNLGAKEDYSLTEMAEAVISCMNKGSYELVANDLSRYGGNMLDSHLFIETFGWKQGWSLQDSIMNIIECDDTSSYGVAI